MTSNYPDHLLCKDRQKLDVSEFDSGSKFYRGFSKNDLDEDGEIKTETLQAPDLSCNWERFSEPEDVRYRENGSLEDGCFQFGIAEVRFQNMANPVHDPLCSGEVENYSHCELRSLKNGEGFSFEPPKKRNRSSGKIAKKRRFEWRSNLRIKLTIVLQPL